MEDTDKRIPNVEQWKALGEVINNAGGVKVLTEADYNYPADDPNGVAVWLLPDGFYEDLSLTGVVYPDASSSKRPLPFFIKTTESNGYAKAVYYQENTWKYWETNSDTGARVSSGNVTPEIVQSAGISDASVMSQKATTSMVFADPATKQKVWIGLGGTTTGVRAVSIGASNHVTGDNSVMIGNNGGVIGDNGIAIGGGAAARAKGSVAIGRSAIATEQGTVVFRGADNFGYNNSEYLLLTGLYDPQSDHDAATKGYVDNLVGDIEAALNVINNGGNS